MVFLGPEHGDFLYNLKFVDKILGIVRLVDALFTCEYAIIRGEKVNIVFRQLKSRPEYYF